MNIGRRLNDLYNKLDSKKIKERKDAFEALTEILQEPNCTALLDKNSDTKGKGVTWTQIFVSAHNGAILEAESCLTDETPNKTYNAKTAISTVVDLVAKANSETARLSTNEVILCVMEAAELPHNRSLFSEGYSRLVHDYVLTRKKYWGELNLDHWINLMRFCRIQLEGQTSENMKCTLMSSLNLICLHGSNFSKFLFHIHRLLKELPSILNQAEMNQTPRLQMHLIQLALTVCQQTKEEYRYSVCKFGEATFPMLLMLYESRDASGINRKEIIAQLLTEVVEVHHPCGVLADSPGALAISLEEWKSHLRTLYQSLEYGITNSKNVLSPCILHLAVICAKQIFSVGSLNKYNSQEALDFSCDSQSAMKKRKLDLGIESLISAIQSKPIADIDPLLIFIEALIIKYPELFRPEDFVSLLQFTSDKLPVCTVTSVTKQLCRIAINLVDLENTLTDKLEDISKQIQGLWTNIWNTAIGFLHFSKEIGLKEPSEETHPLVRALINRGCRTFMADSLLKLYLNGLLPFAEESLKTFICLCQNFVITETFELRIKLLEWLIINRVLDDPILAVLCAHATFALLLKSKLPTEKKTKQENKWNESEVYFLSSSLEHVPNLPSTTRDNNDVNIREYPQLLKEAIKGFKEKENEFLLMNDALVYLPYATVLVVLTSLSAKYQISEYQEIRQILDSFLNLLWPFLTNHLNDDNKEKAMHELLIATNVFFEEIVKHPDYVQKRNVEKMAQHVFVLFIKDDKNSIMQAVQEISSLNQFVLKDLEEIVKINYTEVPDVQLNALKLIMNLASINSICNKNYCIEDYLFTLFKDTVQISTLKGFKIALMVLKTTLARKKLPGDILSNVLDLLREIYQLRFKQHEELILILDLTKSVIPHVYNSSDSDHHDDLCLLISTCSRIMINKKDYGCRIIKQFVDLLITMVEIDQAYKWKIEHAGNGTHLPTNLQILEFFKSPSNLVRIKAIEYIPIIFKNKAVSLDLFEIQAKAFTELMEAASDLLSMRGDLDTEDIEEEALKRSCCALKIISTIITNLCTWRQEALFKLAVLIASKNISKHLIDRVLNQIQRDMKLDDVILFLKQNLNYVVDTWYNNFKNFQDFPFSLIGCKSREDFIIEYKHIIVPLVISNLDQKQLEVITKMIKIDAATLVQGCFPEVAACLLSRISPTEELQHTASYKLIEKIIGIKKFPEFLSLMFEKVVICVFSRLRDMHYFEQLCGDEHSVNFPAKTSLNIDYSGMSAALTYLQQSSPDSQVPLLVLVGIEHPLHIHHMMHTLYAYVTEATCNEIRALYFSHYVAFCDELLKNITPVNQIGGYILRQLLHGLLRFCQTELAVPVLHYMYRAIQISLPQCDVVNDLLPHIVPVLVTFVKIDSNRSEIAMKILEYLFGSRSMFPGIEDLDPLPSGENFARLKIENNDCKSLKQEIEKFLYAGSQNLDPMYRIEGLKHLNQQLISRKNELTKLYDELKLSRGFSEDCAQSVLHRLIVSLVQLTASKNQEIMKSASRCLGEIGPCDLTTLVLMPESATQPPSLCSKIISLLLPLLVHPNPSVQSSTSSLFIELLKTKIGNTAKNRLRIIDKCYISPFIAQTKKQKKSYSVEISFECLNKSMENWCPDDIYQTHSRWLTNLTVSILSSFNDSLFKLIIPIAKSQVNIASELLPYLVSIAMAQHDSFLGLIENKINVFLENHFNIAHGLTQLNHYDKKIVPVYMNHASVQCMLSIINFCRQERATTEVKLSSPLKLNYLYIAQAAQYCKAYFTSVFYAELWAEQISSYTASKQFSNLSPLDKICHSKPQEALVLQNLLWEAYKEIGEIDAVYGCGNVYLAETSRRIKFYTQMGLWSKVIEEWELNQDPAYSQNLAEALRLSGNFKTAMQLCNEKADYDCAWRLGDWSLNMPTEDTYSSLVYGALKSVHNKDKISVCQFVDSARVLVANSLKHASLEVANSIYQPLSRLRALLELEVLGCENPVELRWTNDNGRWVDFEPIYYQRCLLMDEQALPSVWLNMAEKATKFESYLVAQRCLDNIDQMSPNKDILDVVILRKAQIAWKTGHTFRAKCLMKKLLDEKNKTNSSTLSETLLSYVACLAESKSDTASSNMEQYIMKAKSLSLESNKERLAAADCLAKYADSEYQKLKAYYTSFEFVEKSKNAKLSTMKLLDLKKDVSSNSNDFVKAVRSHEVQIALYKEEAENVQREIYLYLKIAIMEYINCLILGEGDSNDLKMFRFVSLWLDIINVTEEKSFGEELGQSILKIPSYKFICVLPQLAARLTDDVSMSSRIMNTIILTCCKEHPYHAIPVILALVNSNADEQFTNPNKTTSKKDLNEELGNLKPRIRGAKIIHHTLAIDEKISKIMSKMQDLFMSYISLANLETKNMKMGDYIIPPSEPIRKLKGLNLPCISDSLPINKTGDYSNIKTIKRYEEVYTLIGGVNQHKKIKCVCSDGSVSTQLVNGKDDLRQDAVMQQVFTVLNALLRNDESTASRKLLIRTYKVVPLSQRSGVIEWVHNTIPLSEYLSGTKYQHGAHKRYRPNDLTPIECRAKMRDVCQENAETKLKTYNEVCGKMQPVFRHFFTEKYPTPTLWFESKLAYTRSVATNSMIGYILGIGDRHVANILLDIKTAEVVHIDFGIAFEQARKLPMPERVPFRLTRDIVDGMGVTGVEGVFRRCCEETLRVLRKCQEPILTTLEVILYDPLYDWSFTPERAQNVQCDDKADRMNSIDLEEKSSDELNTLAMWALQRLKQKLEGRKGGESRSVEGQVNYLINKATDPAKLCLLYNGWQACL